jgi:predicted DCC family thiol-disulfide oxidoreductase YuxK
MRVGIGLVILIDLLQRLFGQFYAFHSEFGVFPQNALRELWGGPWFWSLYYFSVGDWWAILLLFTNVLFAVALIFGFKTRFVTLVCWVLQISLQARTPLILQSGDVLLRLLLFWALFLPWGAYYSVDSALEKKDQKRPKLLLSAATAAYTLQVIYVYFFSVLLKDGKQWTTEGSSVYYALNIDQFATPLALWLRTLPFEVLKALNFGVYYFEMIGSVLLLVTWRNGWIRLFTILGFWSMHLGFGAGLDIGNFVWISIFSTAGLIPSSFWDRYSKFSTQGSGTAYYDQDCGFCVRMVAICKTFLILPESTFRPAQTDSSILKTLEKEDSWVFRNSDGVTFVRAEALRELFRSSVYFRWLTFLFSIPGVIPVGNSVYRWIAKNRNHVCDPNDKPFQKTLAFFHLSTWQSAFCSLAIVFITLWNIGTLTNAPFRWAQKYEAFAYILRIDQKWEMFAPFPLIDDGWYVIRGKTVTGIDVDPLTGTTPTDIKPYDVRGTYQDFRWRKYMMNIWAAAYSGYRLSYGRYLCRSWNSVHQGSLHLSTFEIFYMREDTPPPGQPFLPTRATSIWKHNCFGK